MTDLVERLRDWPNMTPIACKEAAAEIERLRVENWQLKGALGYPVPGHIPDNSGFKCGLCEAKANDIIDATAEIERLRGVIEKPVAGSLDRLAELAILVKKREQEIELLRAEIERLRTALKRGDT